MMRTGFYSRLLSAFAILLSVVLTGLGIVLGQFFSIFAENLSPTVEKQYWLFLFITLVLMFALGMFVAARMLRHYARPIDEVTKIAKLVAKGDYQARVNMNDSELDNDLSIALNKIASNLQEISMLRTMERERLKTLIESMGSGLLMFGREGAVNLVNGVFQQTFQLNENELLGKTFKEIHLPTAIENLIEEVFLTEQPHEKQVHIFVGGQSSYMSVYGAPVIGHHGNWLGIIVVMHDITELVRLEEIRKDFVANVSHELRTPVTSIKGFSETLLDGAFENPAISKEFLEIIYKESNRLHLLIDDLLELSGMERLGFSLSKKELNLRPIIEDAMQIVSGKAEKKEMKLQLDMPSSLIIQVDADRLIQVMVNLLSNAISYSPSHTTVKINASRKGQETIIEVQDEGIGIPNSELPRLFERFYRVDRARNRESGGTGLGLAIVKHLVEAHEGYVEVESEVGVGTVFRVHLPVTTEE